MSDVKVIIDKVEVGTIIVTGSWQPWIGTSSDYTYRAIRIHGHLSRDLFPFVVYARDVMAKLVQFDFLLPFSTRFMVKLSDVNKPFPEGIHELVIAPFWAFPFLPVLQAGPDVSTTIDTTGRNDFSESK